MGQGRSSSKELYASFRGDSGNGHSEPLLAGIEEPEPEVGRTVPELYGDPPPTGATDFDLCFVFALPGFHRHLETLLGGCSKNQHQKRSSRELKVEATQAAEDEEDHFLRELHERSVRRPETGTNYSDCAKDLMKQFLVEEEKNLKMELSSRIGSLEDARIAILDAFLNLVRRDEEPFYSYIFTSVDKDELIVCVKMVEQTALRHAFDSHYALPLSIEAIQDKDMLNFGLKPGPSGEDGPAMKPAWLPFTFDTSELFAQHRCEVNPDEHNLTRKIDDIRLLYDRITDSMDLEGMIKWGMLKDYFPLHSIKPLEYLRSKWARPCHFLSLTQPIEEIRTYFGENVALYFVFTEHVCRYTRYFAIVGVLVFVADLLALSLGRDPLAGKEGSSVWDLAGAKCGVPKLRLAMAIFVILWCNVFVVHLRRKVSFYLQVWGSDMSRGDLVKKQLNPRFAQFAKLMHSEVDSNDTELNVPRPRRQRGRIFSLLCSCLFISILFLSVGSFFKAQAYLYSVNRPSQAKLVSYGLIIQIKVFTAIWTNVCQYLTDREHHQEMIEYDNSCALKTFYVQYINMYSSFYYIAFLMYLWGDTSYENYGTPWSYVTYQMIVTFGLYLVFSAYDLISPLWSLYSSKKAELKKLKKIGKLPDNATALEYSFIEYQTKMEIFDGAKENDDYMDILAVFGFVLLFGITLPVGAVAAFAYIALQMRVDAWKLTQAMRRPYPRRAPKRWVWLNLVDKLALAGTVTNAGLICIMEPVVNFKLTYKLITFFVLVAASAFSRLTLAWLVPEVSEDMLLAQRRHQRQMQAVQKYASEKHKNKAEQQRVLLKGRSNTCFWTVPGLEKKRAQFEPPPV